MSTRREPDFLTPPGDDSKEPEVAYTSTSTLKRLFVRAAIVCSILGIGVFTGSLATGEWYGVIAGVVWLLCGALAVRQNWKVRNKQRIHAAHQIRWALAGTVLFLLGVLVLVLGNKVAG